MCNSEIIRVLEMLTGKESKESALFNSLEFDCDNLNLGFSQFNEIMLLLGFDRVNHFFFSFLAGKPLATSIDSIATLKKGAEEFVKISLLLFGNINYAFKNLSNDAEEFEKWIDSKTPLKRSHFSDRHNPILGIDKIEEDKTYYLGYIVQDEINRKLSVDPSDQKALTDRATRDEVVEKGKRNQEAYLASDHMDVYVATSMRLKHEFLFVSRTTEEIFRQLEDLKLRYFDPTQAYCEDRIDKGLSEGLMLKRARCTIYLAQESDTLGKDSELASTLAQGKPVIAYVPHGTSEYVESLIANLLILDSGTSKKQHILSQLKIFNPSLAWEKPEVLNLGEDALLLELKSTVDKYYNKRAQNLSETHPLGIQVNLSTGVANGVLVVRTTKDCANLLRNIVTNNLEFYLDTKTVGGATYWLLKEKISNCIYRAITANKSLTNSFWNYYLD